MSRLTAIYPGSFDPLTNGHLDLIQRGQRIFDRLVVAVVVNPRKTGLFSLGERVEMIEEVVGKYSNIEVDQFEGLLVDYASAKGAQVILRGLRAVSDFEYEFQMANMNRNLAPQVETCFLMTGERHFYVSSQIIREVATLGGSVSGLVPEKVEARLRKRFGGGDQ